jgi:hypothetical protein
VYHEYINDAVYRFAAQTTKARDLRYASTISYERRAREWDREQLTQEKLLAADQSKQDEENRPLTYVPH